MERKIMETLLKMVIITMFFCSCAISETDKLLKEADIFLNKNIEELVEKIDSNDISVQIRAMAEYTRFLAVLEELDNHRKNMSVKQLEKYLLLIAKAIQVTAELADGDRAQTALTDPSSPYIGRRPTFATYTGIGPVTTRTKDERSHTVTVVMHLEYDKDDSTAFAELNGNQLLLQDFVRRYFAGKYAAELKPENEARLKRDIQERLNERFLDTGRVRGVLFNRLDVTETY